MPKGGRPKGKGPLKASSQSVSPGPKSATASPGPSKTTTTRKAPTPAPSIPSDKETSPISVSEHESDDAAGTKIAERRAKAREAHKKRKRYRKSHAEIPTGGQVYVPPPVNLHGWDEPDHDPDYIDNADWKAPHMINKEGPYKLDGESFTRLGTDVENLFGPDNRYDPERNRFYFAYPWWAEEFRHSKPTWWTGVCTLPRPLTRVLLSLQCANKLHGNNMDVAKNIEDWIKFATIPERENHPTDEEKAVAEQLRALRKGHENFDILDLATFLVLDYMSHRQVGRPSRAPSKQHLMMVNGKAINTEVEFGLRVSHHFS